jgi:hypothetical protein
MSSQLFSRSLSVVAAGTLVIGLGACTFGGGSDSPPSSSTSPISVATTVSAAPTPTPSTSAAAGSVTSGDKSFSVVAPTGWKKVTEKPATLALKAPTAQDRVTTNFNVVVQSPQPVPALDDVVSQAEIAWRQQGIHLTDKPDRTIAGLPSRGYTFVRTAQGVKFAQTQYFIVYREHVYSLTMTSAASPTASSAADQALDAILTTWAWTAG